jgi:hemolysin activation/secretion protein
MNTSEGTDYVRADYSLAVGDSGLRLGVNASYLRYRLIQDSFDALDADGSAKTAGLIASYPLARRSDFNLSLTGSIDHERLIDRTVAGETSNRHVTFASIGLSGYALSPSLGDGATIFGAALTVGDSDQRNAAARAVDQATRRVQGSFTKLGYNAGYQYPFSNATSLVATLRGQFANKNLDSSARMSLGGPNAVRAYPTGEALGDEAWLAGLALSHKLGDTLAANVFLDTGGVTLNRNTWANWNAANPRLDNRYTLSGIGVGLDWRVGPAVVTASVATPLGSNPGRDANDKNIDGSPQHRTRGWIGANAQF